MKHHFFSFLVIFSVIFFVGCQNKETNESAKKALELEKKVAELEKKVEDMLASTKKAEENVKVEKKEKEIEVNQEIAPDKEIVTNRKKRHPKMRLFAIPEGGWSEEWQREVDAIDAANKIENHFRFADVDSYTDSGNFRYDDTDGIEKIYYEKGDFHKYVKHFWVCEARPRPIVNHKWIGQHCIFFFQYEKLQVSDASGNQHTLRFETQKDTRVLVFLDEKVCPGAMIENLKQDLDTGRTTAKIYIIGSGVYNLDMPLKYSLIGAP